MNKIWKIISAVSLGLSLIAIVISLAILSLLLSMKNEIDKLHNTSGLLSSTINQKNNLSDDVYNFLIIGNSITLHKKCSYWYGEWGMAATKAENDYFHLLADNIARVKPVIGTAVNFSTWELVSHDRVQSLSMLDKYLKVNLDLIIIQLGENVVELTDFYNDFEDLLSYLKIRSPYAQLIIMGDFWYEQVREAIKIECAEKSGGHYISLAAIADIEYQCGIGAKVYGDDGKQYIVENSGVSKHPNDRAMSYYTTEIVKILEL